MASFLAGQAGVDVNGKDKPSGHTPLHRVCIAGQTRDKVRSEEGNSCIVNSCIYGIEYFRVQVHILVVTGKALASRGRRV